MMPNQKVPFPAAFALPKGRPLLRYVGFFLLVLALLDVIILVAAGPLLTLRDRVSHADVIVVIGGDGPPRAARGAELWLAGVAPRVLVSGAGDCLSNRDAMIRKGVDKDAISVECRSHSTEENAAFSAPILANMNVRQAVLVTSWYHSRRAIACFSETSSGIRWTSVPAKPRPISWMLFFDPEGIAVLQEGLKTVWYELNGLCTPVRQPEATPVKSQSGNSGS
ncbi:uncharacterized SAM-binding protein YcdF (DUF218 family) [Rhizobium sp. BK376]|nr:uncharacterized SAM-binding protein YcdF (DUF218 family) [Rhizobium sp. BK376]